MPRKRITPAMELEIVRSIIFGGANVPITEEYLAERFKVSRTPVRELLNQLQREGLLTRRNKRGTTLRIPGRDELSAITDIRELLEGYAIRKAAKNMNPARINKLKRLAMKYENCLKNNNIVGIEQADLAFHMSLVRFSGNQHLAKMAENSHMIVKCFTLGRYLYSKTEREYKDVNPCRHMDIVKALEDGNPGTAASILQKHIRASGKKMLQSYDAEG